MRTLAAALFLGAAAWTAGPARAAQPLKDLASGRYEVTVDGMLCHTCARVIAQEVAALPQVEKASVDFERDLLLVTVKPDQTLTLSRLRRALKRAAKRVDLGTTFTVSAVTYKIT